MEDKIKIANKIVAKAQKELTSVFGYEIAVLYRKVECPELTVEEKKIIWIISKEYEIPFAEMQSNTRLANIVFARHIAMVVLYNTVTRSSPRIGNIFGGRDHTTVLNALYRYKCDAEFQKEANKMIKKLGK